MSTMLYIQASGYSISFSYDEKTELWCASIFELGTMGQGKTKVLAMKDLGLALSDMMDSYVKDGLELPQFVTSTTTTNWRSESR